MNNINQINCVIILIILIAAAYIASWAVLKYSLKMKILDLPNNRSMHKIPTPSGGGLGFIIVFIIGVIYLFIKNYINQQLLIMIMPGVIALTAIGYYDDRKELSAKFRFLIHLLIAAFNTFLVIKYTEPNSNYITLTFFFLATTWLINCYNFIDGLDGLAISEAITTALAIAIIFYSSSNTSIIALVLLAVTLPFTAFNWSPAKIFMGDTASGTIGFIFATIWYYSYYIERNNFFVIPILLAVFIVDGTFTLLWRMIKKEKWYMAHKKHAFQYATKKFKHKNIVKTVIIINIAWLLPIAYICNYYNPTSQIGVASSWICLGIAYAPIIIAYFYIKFAYKNIEEKI